MLAPFERGRLAPPSNASYERARAIFSNAPLAGSSDAARFRAFWGPEKCEARRFRDGRVVEAVVWGKPEGADGDGWKANVPERAVRHALARHEPRRCGAAVRADRDDRAIVARRLYAACEADVLDDADAARAARARGAFDAVAAALRNADAPLRVEHVSACSARRPRGESKQPRRSLESSRNPGSGTSF